MDLFWKMKGRVQARRILELFLSIYSIFFSTDSLPSHLNNNPPSFQVSKRDATMFPAIYLDRGLLNCGAPLVKDQCSAYPLNYSTTVAQQTFSVHAQFFTSINTTYSILSNNHTVTIPLMDSWNFRGLMRLRLLILHLLLELV